MTSRELRILVHGAKGRMGARILASAAEIEGCHVVAQLDRGDADAWRKSRAGAPRMDVVIDFSSDEGARSAASIAGSEPAALLVGTTGLSEQSLSLLRDASTRVAVMVAPNTSVGVALAGQLVREAARALGSGYDVDIVEWHHRNKVDAPSGTAKFLAQAAGDGGMKVAPERIHAVRSGDIIGEHLVTFAGPGEVLEIRHRATSRDLFARGAITLAGWLAGRRAGMHTVAEWLAERRAGGAAR